MQTEVTTLQQEPPFPSQQIDVYFQHLNDDWRGETLGWVRALIRQAVPDMVEAVKGRGVPVWEKAGIISKVETDKNGVKPTFAKGASLDGPSRLFDAGFERSTRRPIDLHEGAALEPKAFMALIPAAASLDASQAAQRPARAQS
ncbi:DUF1801 domain-containing protein [Microvirga aerilata]|uniref:DUF1801 domain-containing protein n=1 Tax=Microvirga aerilata TaxID=670292 RepID=A0A936Z820_9HYPH|nr:DUF1801 domain-containing protein [Microvirga aerilata]MBL0405306.1 DUF1801 domain-containing protein [Microvirga aerilata]